MNAALFFVIKTLLDLYLIAYILRFLLQWVRADFHNPLSQFILRITDPVVRPLRRVVPGWRGVDLSPLVALLILQLLVTTMLQFMAVGTVTDPLTLTYYAVLRIIIGTIRLYFFAILVHVIISWVSPGHWNPLINVIQSLVQPVLRPIRRIIPPIGGLDLTPLFVLIGLQALLIMIRVPGYLL
ncbi:YggT family protein [Wenzhouxiangella sp. XN24]|uniref:YggT family protein n=1 Tax=Wenzhouxiangella sp. XN24 TaxID=2713569 RepID=UPI0013E9F95C|nr:YggT family protein [Wenzhouxiangella sp. XN24]NGX16084.1 YggT family protein [Wenzhouxiangella sp. XN24]